MCVFKIPMEKNKKKKKKERNGGSMHKNFNRLLRMGSVFDFNNNGCACTHKKLDSVVIESPLFGISVCLLAYISN